MGSCACGNALDDFDILCARCRALQTLGLEAGAAEKQIESTYRVLVKVWHPDRFQNDPALKLAAEEKLKSINSAHSYLTSAQGVRGPGRTEAADRKRTQARDGNRRSSNASKPGIRWPPPTHRRTRWEPWGATGIAVRIVILVCGLGVSGAILVGVEAYLLANPKTASVYRTYRNAMWQDMEAQGARVWDRVEGSLRKLKVASSTPTTAPISETAGKNSSEQKAGEVPLPNPPHVPMPYVTVGLTKDEVIEVMGTPSSSSNGALRFGRSVFYFRNGAVAGWNVDRSLIPLQVKLWPRGHFDPSITSFTVGSSKDDVIAVQGTPTLLTENKFAYGESEVFFENGKVTGWRDNRGSEPLRTAAAH